MRTDSLGIPIFDYDDAVNLIYRGQSSLLPHLLFEKHQVIDQFNRSAEDLSADVELKSYTPLDVNQKEFDSLLQQTWFMPDRAKIFDIETYVKQITPKNATAQQRVNEELAAFRQHNMIDVLKFLHYLVETLRKHQITWGVGRGSSVASYVLYLLGVHRIDSIQYQLDWREFLR